MEEVIKQEERRLVEVYEAIERCASDRSASVAKHDARTRELEKERLEALGWREKNSITEKLVEHGHHDPRKYLPEFEQRHSPYFGVIGIDDSDRRIGKKEYLIGRQMLMDGNKVLIVDWRQAEISQLFYDFEEGEEYEATIRGRDREGILTLKRKIGIERKVLKRIETGSETYTVCGDGWRGSGDAAPSSADTKAEMSDHRMVDIVSLISAEQFRMITRNSSGCTFLSGAAGSGKTTVALHRLSFLQFQEPQLFRRERCLVLMFNRTLRDYVRKTSDDLLGDTRVDTFSAWALGAVHQLGLTVRTSFEDSFAPQKKDSRISGLLARYVAATKRMDPVLDLWKFYLEPTVSETLFADARQRDSFRSEIQGKIERKDRLVSFSDLSILLRLCQLRRPAESVVQGALNFYDHIVIDEAQDFAQIELEAILAATSARRSLTVCADDKQKILSFVDAEGFLKFRTQLNTLGLERETLSLSYRSGREIMELAAKVSGRHGEVAGTHGGIVRFHEAGDFAGAVRSLRQLVAERLQEDAKSLTAVICRKKADVKQVHAALQGIEGLHEEGGISFEPGVLVVNSHQVKGLEFTNVVLWNPSESEYRQSEIDTNLLYVAITRACKRIDIVHFAPLAKALRG
ncbi:UvrD-helicase domain-containing protein [Geomonas sp. RF6]|uniref:UvrD-helicase domain-containing protein n=1 Tax=Geomonas sp. RF6 TaxID=2897342 RepID=UPI001E3FD3DB|nr:UvrD-helicase domain-containing protein [Geomonas sp. RF6]UFS69046.1 UvrD-helicase domain-containing protein [Geomonas sp. RF6]